MWAVNAIKNGWAEDVEVVLFGPIEDAVARGDKRFVPWIERLRELRKLPRACRRIAEEKGFEEILGKNSRVGYVGAIIAELIRRRLRSNDVLMKKASRKDFLTAIQTFFR
ncbi:hypothetical protein [Thermococcus sp. MV11]|uniref:hypothetical protein n=1 Tax=Thermococcus sp. MV11 TaxID=1638267 RepID=UPI001F0E8AE1|nr:hypothetical protein [Thermococcus sp. MV11]